MFAKMLAEAVKFGLWLQLLDRVGLLQKLMEIQVDLRIDMFQHEH